MLIFIIQMITSHANLCYRNDYVTLGIGYFINPTAIKEFMQLPAKKNKVVLS